MSNYSPNLCYDTLTPYETIIQFLKPPFPTYNSDFQSVNSISFELSIGTYCVIILITKVQLKSIFKYCLLIFIFSMYKLRKPIRYISGKTLDLVISADRL